MRCKLKSFEDHFSEHARDYLKNRPQYPDALFEYLANISPARRLAWDCGTGNGQAARMLARYFDRVLATDASSDQIGLAVPHERIEYRVERAEDVNVKAHSVDLVSVATAVHWFDLEPFYQAVRRAGRPDGILAVWTYHAAVINPAIDQILEFYYVDVLAGYWPERFHYLADRYQTLPFPFEEVNPPQFTMQVDWDLGQLVGFLDSWSATRRYQKEQGRSPIGLVWDDLFETWGEPDQRRRVSWPLYMRVGRIG